MTRVNVVLLTIVVVFAIFLVRVQYDTRKLFTALDKAVAEQRHLETENARLSVDKRAEATSLRVETLAKTKLDMRLASPATTAYVTGVSALPAPPTTELAHNHESFGVRQEATQ